MLQHEGQIPAKTVTETSSKLVSHIEKYEPIPILALSAELGKSEF